MRKDPYAFRFEYEKADYEGDNLKLVIENATDEDLHTFEYHPNTTELVVIGDWVDHLTIPDGVAMAYVGGLALKTLYVPDSVTFLRCPKNCLRTLELPAGIETVHAYKNKLRTITFRAPPTALGSLDIHDNRMAGLEFAVPPTLEHIDIHESGLKWSTIGPCLTQYLLQYDGELGSSLHDIEGV
jgi:hypothetical protein